MSKLTIYQKPTCSTCRQAVQLLRESGMPFTTVNYYEERFTKSRLTALLKKAGLSPRDILRSKEDLYKKLELAKTTLSDDALIDLIQRGKKRGERGGLRMRVRLRRHH